VQSKAHLHGGSDEPAFIFQSAVMAFVFRQQNHFDILKACFSSMVKKTFNNIS
jgi:hypothetical protein